MFVQGRLPFWNLTKKTPTFGKVQFMSSSTLNLREKTTKPLSMESLSLALSSQQTHGVVMVTINARWQCMSGVSTDPARFCVFLDRIRCEKPDQIHFIFGNSRCLRVLYKYHFSSQNTAECRLHRWLPEFEQESDSQIKKKNFIRSQKFGTGPVSENVTAASSGVCVVCYQYFT